eukprot:CAMPEP_0168315396 /NCGR_PEP_ID=MMETSP0210-20121227/11108_1 /TAXON_ID=40633 /ORGANISM="Condylostoma magnum, Strain COL2" /LENGTH=46 /DNA_ID= /DNA_START= /DNA_END= /DNA_ORIENTATION=
MEGEREVCLDEAFDDYEELGNFYEYSGSLTTPGCDEVATFFLWNRV